MQKNSDLSKVLCFCYVNVNKVFIAINKENCVHCPPIHQITLGRHTSDINNRLIQLRVRVLFTGNR
jgi:hypothetical protein